jgi:hypothetical protein
MLCDEVVADKAAGSGCDITGMLPIITRAPKFVLGPEFASVADALSNDYTGLVKAFEHCRLPFPQVWVEFAQTERPNFMNASVQIPEAQVRPKRVGFLLTATRTDLSAWKAHLFWSTDLGTSCAGLAMNFDMTRTLTDNEALPTEQEISVARSNFRWVKNIQPHPGWHSASESVRLAMMRHTDPIMPDYGIPYPPGGIADDEVDRYCRMVAELARSDWAGEPGFLLAVIGLLNARNVVEMQSVDYDKLNKARIKRGKLPLFEHKILKIAERQQRRVYGPDGARGDFTPMRGHIVRGHFKTRKTGIFFWHPFGRGDFTRGRITKDYVTT